MIVMAFMLASCSYGFGQHIANLSPSNKIMTLKVNIVLYCRQYKLMQSSDVFC